MKTEQLLKISVQSDWILLALFLLLPRGVFAQSPFATTASPVRITSPANRATFYTPVDIPIFAFAGRTAITGPIAVPGASITNVEFYAGTNDLGSGQNLGSTSSRSTVSYANLFGVPVPALGGTFCLTWSNPPVGGYLLTAVAKNSAGLSRTSAPVNITILASATNSNPTGTVSIIATDPVAIAGTNAYVWRGVTNATPSWTNWSGAFQWFTNWGPKDALFTLARYGDASSNLTVNYSIGGTASNGVDYAALPGYAIIPAGSAYALIPIVPIDNGASNINKTIILTLTASTNAPASYIVGSPSRAAGIIMENWRRLAASALAGDSFHLVATGPDGAWFCIQYSTDLVSWSTVSTNQVFQGSIDFVDPDTTTSASRYYRAVPIVGTPTQ